MNSVTMPFPQKAVEKSRIKHKIAFTDYWRLEPELQDYLLKIGAHIVHRGKDDYSLIFSNGDGRYDLHGTKEQVSSYARFLYKPLEETPRIYASLEIKSDLDSKREELNNIPFLKRKFRDRISVLSKEWQHRSGIKEKRIARHARQDIHTLLRYSLTDSPEIPIYAHSSLAEEGAECHAGPQQKIEESKMLRKTGDIDIKGRVDNYDKDNEKEPLETALLPHTRFDPIHGFSFDLGQRIINPSTESEKEISNWFWNAINKATDEAPDFDGKTLYLKPLELHDFCLQAYRATKQDELQELTNNVKSEDGFNAIIDDIDDTLSNITNQDHPSYKIFQSFIQDSLKHKQDPKERAINLLRSTSALNDQLGHNILEKEFYFQHITQKIQKSFTGEAENQAEEIQEDIAMLQKTLEHYSKNGDINEVTLEAIIWHPKFFPLISFARDFTKIMEGDLKRIKPRKRSAEEEKQLHQYNKMAQVFENSSASGLMMGRDHMPDDYQDILDLMEVATNQGGAGLARVTKQGIEGYVDFLNDIFVVAPKESPKATVALIGALYVWSKFSSSGLINSILAGIDDDTASDAVNDAFTGESFDMGDFGDDAKFDESSSQLAGIVRDETAKKEGIENIDWHWHNTPYGRYKHWFVGSIANTAKTVASLTDAAAGAAVERIFNVEPVANTGFMEAANEAAKKSAAVSFVFNLLQNGPAHMVMYARFISQNAKYGGAGFLWMLSFFNKTVDALYVAARQKSAIVALGATGAIFDNYDPATQLLSDLLGFNEKLQTGMLLTVVGAIIGSKLPHMARNKAGAIAKALMQSSEERMKSIIDVPIEELLQDLDEAALKMLSFKYENKRKFNLTNKIRIPLNRKVRGLGEDFSFNADNYAETMHAFKQMDVALSTFADNLDIQSPLYTNFLKQKLKKVVKSINGYIDGSIDSKELEKTFIDNLDHLVGAQLYLNGNSSIYEKLCGHEPSKRQKRHLRLKATYDFSHYKRKAANMDSKKELADKLENIEKLHEDLRKASAAPNGSGERLYKMDLQEKILKENLKILGDGAKIGARETIDKLHLTLKELRHTTNSVPGKRWYLASSILTGMAATMMQKAGYDGPMQNLVNDVANAYGFASSLSVATAIFALVNYIDDQVFVHFVLGGAAGAAGLGYYETFRQGVSPLYRWSMQEIRKNNLDPILILAEERKKRWDEDTLSQLPKLETI